MSKKERFFGLHFDFHANDECEIGTRTNPEDIEWYINQAKPDFIQCDCKGHLGISSYPTKVGKAADRIKSDNLRIWVDVAKKHNIPIYVHYSGVLDDYYANKNPESAAKNKEGEIDKLNGFGAVSVFGNYVDKLLIPQIKELITDYGIDGIWIDGDCWAVHCDYSDNAKPYLNSGMTEEEHKRVMGDAYFEYARKYTNAIHAFAPDFQITSNWAYSSYMPEKPDVDFDFLSGDFNPNDSVFSARYEGRCLADRGLPWDLMSWGFTGGNTFEKATVELCQEAAMVLALGGGYQVYTKQNKDGSAKKTLSNRYQELGEFVRARRINFGKKLLAQTAVFYSAESRYKTGNIFNAQGATECILGTLHAILDAQYTANVVMEYQTESLKDYDVVVVPEWEYMSKDTDKKLLMYAKNGGNLLIIGSKLCSKWASFIDEEFIEYSDMRELFIMDNEGYFAEIKGNYTDLIEGQDQIYTQNDIRDTSGMPAYRTEIYGNGSITFVPFNFGSYYYRNRSYVLRNYISKIFNSLFKPFIEINKKHVDITMLENKDGILVNLVNINQGRHHDFYYVYDEIPTVHNIEIIVNKKYNNISMPLGEYFEVEKLENGIKIKLSQLDIHSIIELS